VKQSKKSSQLKNCDNLTLDFSSSKLSEYIERNFTEVCLGFDKLEEKSFDDFDQLNVFAPVRMSPKKLEEVSTDVTNFEFSCALLSANDKNEFTDAIKAFADFKYKTKLLGTITNKNYTNLLSLLKIELTGLLFSEENDRRVANYIKILERRMRRHYGKDEVQEETKKEDLKIVFEVVK